MAQPVSAAPARALPLALSPDRVQLVLFGLLIITISRVHQHFGLLVKLRIGLVLTLLAAWVAYVNPRLIRLESPFRQWPAKVMLGLGLMACLSVPFGLSMGASGKFILDGYSKVLIGAFLLVIAVRNVRDLYTLMCGFVAGGLVLAWLSIFVFRIESIGSGGFSRIASGYSFDANDLGTVATTVLAIALLLIAAGNRNGRILGIVTSIGLLVTLAKSGSRGGFLGLLALGLALLVFIRHIALWKKLAIVVVAVGALSVAAPPGYWEQMNTITSPKDDYNWSAPSGRRNIWKRGIGYMMQYPLTGVGIDNFSKAEGTISPLAKAFQEGMPGVRWAAAHNSFVQVGAEMGIPGLALFATLVLGGVLAMDRLGRRMPAQWGRGTPEQRFLYLVPSYLAVGLATFAVAGFFVSFAYWDLVYILAAFMCGTYVCVDNLLAGTTPTPLAATRGGRPARRKS